MYLDIYISIIKEMKYYVVFKVSLILEYCSNGDLRTFLIKNTQELSESIRATTFDRNTDAGLKGLTKDLFLLIVWSYQVRCIKDLCFHELSFIAHNFSTF